MEEDPQTPTSTTPAPDFRNDAAGAPEPAPHPAEGTSANAELSADIPSPMEDPTALASFPRAGEGSESVALEALEDFVDVHPSSSTEDAPPFSVASVLESILFTSQKPVSIREVLQIFRSAAAAAPEDPLLRQLGKTKETDLRDAVDELQAAYEKTGRSFEVRESAAGWQLVTRPVFAPWLRQLFPENRPARLSAPALETLAIIAYRQPITRADIEAVRGVAVDGVMQTLLDRGLVKIAGRAEVPGRPLLYSTTQHFMEHFGLRDLMELPNASELRNRPLPTAPVEPAGQEPVPPEDTAKTETEEDAPNE